MLATTESEIGRAIIIAGGTAERLTDARRMESLEVQERLALATEINGPLDQRLAQIKDPKARAHVENDITIAIVGPTMVDRDQNALYVGFNNGEYLAAAEASGLIEAEGSLSLLGNYIDTSAALQGTGDIARLRTNKGRMKRVGEWNANLSVNNAMEEVVRDDRRVYLAARRTLKTTPENPQEKVVSQLEYWVGGDGTSLEEIKASLRPRTGDKLIDMEVGNFGLPIHTPWAELIDEAISEQAQKIAVNGDAAGVLISHNNGEVVTAERFRQNPLGASLTIDWLTVEETLKGVGEIQVAEINRDSRFIPRLPHPHKLSKKSTFILSGLGTAALTVAGIAFGVKKYRDRS